MRKSYFYFIAMALVLVSCYPEGAEYYEETDLVYTNYDQAFDFGEQASYAMPERIVKITGVSLK